MGKKKVKEAKEETTESSSKSFPNDNGAPLASIKQSLRWISPDEKSIQQVVHSIQNQSYAIVSQVENQNKSSLFLVQKYPYPQVVIVLLGCLFGSFGLLLLWEKEKNQKESKQKNQEEKKISPEGDLLKKNQYEKAPVHEPVLFSNTVFFLNPPSLTVKEKIFCVFRFFIASMGIVVATVFLVKPRPALATPLIPIAEISESGRSALNKARSASYGFLNKKEEKKNHLDLIPDNQEKKRGNSKKK